MQLNIVNTASLIGDVSRANMLIALLGGRALTATELATMADISAPTASSHLAKLLEGGLIIVRRQGRHKYFQLKSLQVADLLESLLTISAESNLKQLVTGPTDERLRQSRVCYDHLAGELSVRLFDALIARGVIEEDIDRTWITEEGKTFFERYQLQFNTLSRTRPLCKSCLDWSERRSHLSGALGQWILNDAFKQGWALRDLDSRAIRFSNEGLKRFSQRYGIV